MQVLVDTLLSKIKKYNPEMNEAQLKTRKYGLEVLLGELSKALIYLLIFALFSLAGHFLLSTIIFCTIRLVTGGYHAKSYLSCLVVTFIIFAAIIFPKPIYRIDHCRTIHHAGAITDYYHTVCAGEAQKYDTEKHGQSWPLQTYIHIVSSVLEWCYVFPARSVEYYCRVYNIRRSCYAAFGEAF